MDPWDLLGLLIAGAVVYVAVLVTGSLWGVLLTGVLLIVLHRAFAGFWP